MITNQDLLNSVLKTTQMGQLGIRCVMDKVSRSPLRESMLSQLEEYDNIEQQAMDLAQRRGWQMRNVPNSAKSMAAMMSRMRLIGGNRDSKIAGMLVQGNTRGMITGLKNLRRCHCTDGQVDQLARNLIAREKDNIHQSSEFL